jgi:hypothetical protein
MAIQYVWDKPSRPALLNSLIIFLSGGAPHHIFRDVTVTDNEVTAFAARQDYEAERSAIWLARGGIGCPFSFRKREISE